VEQETGLINFDKVKEIAAREKPKMVICGASAYSRDWDCPRSHPIKVPRLRFIVTYPIQRPSHLSFSSGGIYSGHADFFNGWRQVALNRLVADCFYYRPRCNQQPR
jgi:hypothetical protein